MFAALFPREQSLDLQTGSFGNILGGYACGAQVVLAENSSPSRIVLAENSPPLRVVLAEISPPLRVEHPGAAPPSPASSARGTYPAAQTS